MSFRNTRTRGRSNTLLSAVLLALALGVASLSAKAQPLYRITPIGNESLGINDLNDKGEVVGASVSEGTQRPIVWRRGVLVLGLSFASGGPVRGWVWHGGQMRELAALPLGTSPQSTPMDINDRGVIVGMTVDSDNPTDPRATLWQNGSVYDLNALVHPSDPWKAYVPLRSATQINNKGQIVATGRDTRTDGRGTQATAFLLTPAH